MRISPFKFREFCKLLDKSSEIIVKVLEKTKKIPGRTQL